MMTTFTDTRIMEVSGMGGIKDVLAHEEMLVIENNRLTEDIEDLRSDLEIERGSHDACHDYFDMLIGLHKAEIEELKEDLAHEIDAHAECHKQFDIVLDRAADDWAEASEDRDFWKRSFDELSAHAIQLQVQLNEARLELSVQEYLIEQDEKTVLSYDRLTSDLFDAFADHAASGETFGLRQIEGILKSLGENARHTFDMIAREYEFYADGVQVVDGAVA